ncbi:MAG: hypothetical protein LC749_03750 [Actinobacteria bacterium]|nr:hypothetical protein [Actinomycetota bacterium]
MRGTTHREQAARGYLARLIVAVGVLAGLVLAHGVQCSGGMTAMATEQVASSGMVVGAAQDSAAPTVMAEVEHHVPDAVIAADAAQQVTAVRVVPDTAGALALAGPSSPGLGGGLVACLAFIVAVAAVMVGLRPAWLRIFGPVLRSGGGHQVTRPAAPRAPSLAELCLLRT